MLLFAYITNDWCSFNILTRNSFRHMCFSEKSLDRVPVYHLNGSSGVCDYFWLNTDTTIWLSIYQIRNIICRKSSTVWNGFCEGHSFQELCHDITFCIFVFRLVIWTTKCFTFRIENIPWYFLTSTDSETHVKLVAYTIFYNISHCFLSIYTIFVYNPLEWLCA